MTRESIEAKARRYLTEGRLYIRTVDGDTVRATCRGDGAVYRCGYDEVWWCNCPARRDCAHLIALRLVTTARDRSGS